MGTSRSTCGTHSTDEVASLDKITLFHINSVQVEENAGYSLTMVNTHHVPMNPKPLGYLPH